VAHADLFGAEPDHASSAVVAERVAQARAAATERWAGQPWRANSDVPGSVLRARPWGLPVSVLREAQDLVETGALTARGYDRVLRLAWTVADLAGHTSPDRGDVGEALFHRTGVESSWAA
jgi:magnesium chelatase family protein